MREWKEQKQNQMLGEMHKQEEENQRRKQEETKKILVELELPSNSRLKIACSADALISDVLKRGITFLLHRNPSLSDLQQYYVMKDGFPQVFLSSDESLLHYNINSDSRLLGKFYVDNVKLVY